MKDYIVRATAANNQVRAFAATTRDVVAVSYTHLDVYKRQGYAGKRSC